MRKEKKQLSNRISCAASTHQQMLKKRLISGNAITASDEATKEEVNHLEEPNLKWLQAAAVARIPSLRVGGCLDLERLPSCLC